MWMRVGRSGCGTWMRRSQPSLPADPAWIRLHAPVRDAIADVGENLSGMVVVIPGHGSKNADDTTDAPSKECRHRSD